MLNHKLISSPPETTKPSIVYLLAHRWFLWALDKAIAILENNSTPDKYRAKSSGLPTVAWLIRNYKIEERSNPRDHRKLFDLLEQARTSFVPDYFKDVEVDKNMEPQGFEVVIQEQFEVPLSKLIKNITITGLNHDPDNDRALPSYKLVYTFDRGRLLTGIFSFNTKLKRYDLEIDNSKAFDDASMIKISLEIMAYASIGLISNTASSED